MVIIGYPLATQYDIKQRQPRLMTSLPSHQLIYIHHSNTYTDYPCCIGYYIYVTTRWHGFDKRTSLDYYLTRRNK